MDAGQYFSEKNIVLLGEAGCGKSEIAVNLAISLSQLHPGHVHFFDLDQTKPLFRSRDLENILKEHEIICHFEEQFADAPTLGGGVEVSLTDPHEWVVMDVGGDDIGARLIGGYSRFLNNQDTKVLYVINPYLPWSGNLLNIDETLSAILQSCHLSSYHLAANPNIGAHTSQEDFRHGLEEICGMVAPYKPIEAAFVRDTLYQKVKNIQKIPVFPIKLYLSYPWQGQLDE